ncbi:putative electron transfer flavoprotein subunit [Physocladia obscura]|uniref:Electron transfer flavoprotein subunit n=1 Tax=Physocladia obscura TaxID=109957 RepID=A0AAD5XHF5_9FUNG|nr:putative electron transfer flavoprotein subunit [Physocladia obscura]
MQGFLQELCDHITIPSVLEIVKDPLLDSNHNQQLDQQAPRTLFHQTSSMYPAQLPHTRLSPFALASDGLFVPATQLQTYEYLLNCNWLVPPIQNHSNISDNNPSSPTHSAHFSSSSSSSPPPSSAYTSHTYDTSPVYSTLPVLSPNSPEAALQFFPANAPSSDPLQIQCINCGTFETSVWRKDSFGRSICNACGLYKKQRGIDRPAAFPFRKAVVRRRKRGKKAAIDEDTIVKAMKETREETLGGSRWLDDLI